jgi:methionyl-tRNA synthetase
MSDKPTFYITTAISYPNGAPHIGHAYEALATDALARFKRLDGYDVFFLTGTDEHGQKIQQTAREKGKSPAEFVDRNGTQVSAMVKALNCSNDDFIRTSEPRHYETVRGDLEAHGRQPATSIWTSMPAGIRCATKPSTVKTNWKTAMVRNSPSRPAHRSNGWRKKATSSSCLPYQDKLLKLYADQPDLSALTERRNEVVSFVKGGLKDLSVSRTTFDWGIPVPGAPGHIMYVWVDALTNYMTATGYLSDPALARSTGQRMHTLSARTLSLSHVYWPAFLMSAGICRCPNACLVMASCSTAVRRCPSRSATWSIRSR